MISVLQLHKRFGRTVALDGITFSARPGEVTAFLGPNGSGKSTTLRILMGLARANSGSATIDGKCIRDLDEPLRHVGCLLDARSFHPSRTAFDHLRSIAMTNGIGTSRVLDVLEIAGLEEVGRRRAGGFSLGMQQRLGVAAALLGDPACLVLDEPINGLDLDGVRWMRDLCRSSADEGRTVLMSSHALGEIAALADRVVVIGRGRILADDAPEALVASSGWETLEDAYVELTEDVIEFGDRQGE